MTREQISLGAALYFILVRIDPKDQAGKMGHKNISKALKKQLAIQASKDPKPYLKIVNDSESVTNEAKIGFERDELKINPGAIMQFAIWRYSELMEPFGIKHLHVMKLKDAYQDGLVWNSVRILNKIVKQIDIYVSENFSEK